MAFLCLFEIANFIVLYPKLDDIKASVSGSNAELAKISETLKTHGERLTAVESSAKQAHHRIDEIIGGK